MLSGRKLLIGVTGSIAAYKSASLARLLIREGAEVKVVMTESAKDFITPLTLSTLSKNPVYSSFFANNTGEWHSHIDLGLWADLFIVAPASANTIAKMAHGLCDNLLTAVYLSSRCPVFIAPAMDLDMYRHEATKNNIELLEKRGVRVIDAGHGELASGLIGEGRMQEPEEILEILRDHFLEDQPLKGKKAIVTAGPTFEAIDPVRFIGNHSTGKMGYAIAKELANKGAMVTLISGPSALDISHQNIEKVSVQSAGQMYDQCISGFVDADILVLAAAVADYKPVEVSAQKMKKHSERWRLELEKTVDIAAELGKLKKTGQFIAGFALETENELVNAKEKLKKKNFDLIVLNSLKDKGAGFGHDTNKITLIMSDNSQKAFELKSKREVAVDIVNQIIEMTDEA